MHNFKKVIALVIAVIITIIIILLLSTTTITPLKAGLFFKPLLFSSNSIVYLGRGFSICSKDQIVGVIVQHLCKAGEDGSRKSLVLTDQSSPQVSLHQHTHTGGNRAPSEAPDNAYLEGQRGSTASPGTYFTGTASLPALSAMQLFGFCFLPHSWCLSY